MLRERRKHDVEADTDSLFLAQARVDGVLQVGRSILDHYSRRGPRDLSRGIRFCIVRTPDQSSDISMPASIESRISQELSATVQQVVAAIALLDEGATVPFISRYRKEATGGLDDTQLRHLRERLIYLRELEERRTAILTSIEEQGTLTPSLRTSIEQADTK